VLTYKPVALLGAGASQADLERILSWQVPILSSWQAADRLDNNHPLYFGRPGIYGQRAANHILWEASHVCPVGTRMAIWNVGYEGVPKEKLVEGLAAAPYEWLAHCKDLRTMHPWLEPGTHDDTPSFINSYRFTAALQQYLRPNEVIVTDMGTPLICAHQVLKLCPPQRIMTSGGLGEMGCALPAAIGASFARGRGEVLCLHADGGMMLNLQELQTIVHYKLPIKIIVYRNEAYLMLRHTQRVAGMEESGIGPTSGVSFPDFRALAHSLGMLACDVRTWDDFKKAIYWFFACPEPALIQYWMDPYQPLVPKLDPVVQPDGTKTSPEFWDLSPKLG
jgi:acetolactate synthase-1/2/3 large subunit